MKNPVFAAVLALALPGALPAQEGARVSPLAPGVEVAADVVSTFVFRGVDITDGPAVQPRATLSLGKTGLSFTAWSSFALTGRDETVPGTALTRGGADELDLTAAFSRPAGPVSLEVGYVAYVYLSGEQDYVSQEVYGTAGLDSLPLAPTLSVFYDFDGGDEGDADTIEGLYASLEVSRSVRIGLPLDLGASLGYTNQEALRPKAGFNDVNVSLGTDLPFGRLTVTPSITYSHLFGDSAYGADGSGTVWGKVQARVEF